MKKGDLVQCDPWVHSGLSGIIVEVQDTEYCVGAYVILETGIKLIRLENLRRINNEKC